MGRRVIFGSCHLLEWKTVTLRVFGGCHSTERSWMEVTACLSIDRPLLDDGLFVNQLEMLYLIDLRSFYCKSFNNVSNNASPFSRVYDHSLSYNRLTTNDVEREWCTCAFIGP
ncbi:unnamed protein product [Spirodela intermedia]|uniref:Uncharacterized protein n=1 Tax=Spirodela intermedia TaxID=51605 RepID=A0A7I8JI13_SPIIN|nr:unnamed protein product [Spirodela intermedia]CAA6669750.1 unnamed protein product [Spirodela intermedia]